MTVNTRWQAFAIHLGISFVIFIVLLGIIFLFWYPGPFIHLGGIEGIQIVAGVDLVLGPLLTLMVYNKAKKSLKIDLAIIACIQFTALVAGTWTVYFERPIVQVLSDDGIYVYSQRDYEANDIPIDQLKKIPGKAPLNVFLDLPDDKNSIAAIKAAHSFFGDNSLTMRANLYIPIRNTPKHKIALRLNKFVLDEQRSCYLVPLTSKHYMDTGDVCYTPDKGIIRI